MDERALREHADFLRGLARSLLRDEHLAEDAVQDAYVAALRREGVSNVRAWLATVTRNLSLRARRRRDGRRRLEQAAARREATPSTEELVVCAETQRRVAQAVLDLDEPYRATILLRYFHHKAPSEIARNAGVPVATVKTRLRRALAGLRETLGDRRKWAVALAPLAGEGRDLPFTFLGTLAMYKTKLIAAGILVALVAGGVVTLASRGDRAAERGERGARRTDTPAAPPAAAAAVLREVVEPEPIEPELASPDERERYLEWRQVAGVLRGAGETFAEAEKLFAELGEKRERKVETPDPARRAYLEEMIAKYRALAAGRKRLDLLGRLVGAHRGYLEATGDTSFLSFLEEVIEGSSVAEERELAIPDGDREAVAALLLRLARHPDAVVRAGALRSLAPAAVDEILRGLEDEASAVRWTAAIQLEFAVADPAHVAVLLDRIGRETHPLAMDGMVKAVEALDPEDGARRVAKAVRDAPPAIRALTRGLREAPPLPRRNEPAVERLRPDDEAREYLERLFEELRALPEGEERVAVIEKLVKTHADYLDRTGDLSFLPALRALPGEAVAGSFTRASHPRVVDLLIGFTTSPDADVRRAAARSLAWTRGAEAARAHEELVKCLADPDRGVRRVTAMLIGKPVADVAHVPAVLAALAGETDFACAYVMVGTVLELDPERGRVRILAAIARAPSATRDVVKRVLSMRGER